MTAPILEGGHGGDHGDHAAHATDALHSTNADHGAATEHAHEVGAHAHEAAQVVYSNPLPSVLMLTAIVVGIATTALALALIVRIREDYGSIEEDEILELDKELQ